jgi:hypothetical protein
MSVCGRLLARMTFAAILTAILVAPAFAFGQAVPTLAQEAPKQVEASLSHSVEKALTLKIASLSIGVVIFRPAPAVWPMVPCCRRLMPQPPSWR